MRPFHCAYVLSKGSAVCCVVLLPLFHAVFHAECIEGRVSRSGGYLRSSVFSLIVAATIALVANAAFLFRPRPRRAWAHAATISSRFAKWKPTWFIVTSVLKLILRAIVIPNAVRGNMRDDSCTLTAFYENQFHAATVLWDCTILLVGTSAIFCDVDADFSPALRRCDHSFLALCLLVDTFGSYFWGNEIAGQVSLSLGNFEFLLDNQITSCITSQMVIALHFMYTSWRSRCGRGWAYESLRFELDECGSELLSKLRAQQQIESGGKWRATVSLTAPAAELENDSDGLQITAASTCNVFRRLRRRLQQYQKDSVSKCRVFVVPCVANETGFAIARPLFDLKVLRPLHSIAEAHPKRYFAVTLACIGLPSIICAIVLQGLAKGVSTLVLNAFLLTSFIVFLSSERYNLDRVAVTRIASSFRFVVCTVLLAEVVVLDFRKAYLDLAAGRTNDGIHFSQVAAFLLVAIFFCICTLIECSPHFPATSQFYFSAAWWFFFGSGMLRDLLHISAGRDIDCFLELGAYRVCAITLNMSIYSNLFLLTTQALLSRMLVPGKSNFVSASILDSSPNNASNSASALASTDDEEGSPPFVQIEMTSGNPYASATDV